MAAASGNDTYIGARNHFTYAETCVIRKANMLGVRAFGRTGPSKTYSGTAQGSAANVAYATVTTFLQDKPTQAILVPNPVPLGYRSWEGAWYLQDEITLRRNLNFRIGLRDEFTDGWNEEAGRCTNYFFNPGGVIQTNPHIASSCFETNNAKLLLQPRVGLAWDPTGRELGPCGRVSESIMT